MMSHRSSLLVLFLLSACCLFAQTGTQTRELAALQALASDQEEQRALALETLYAQGEPDLVLSVFEGFKAGTLYLLDTRPVLATGIRKLPNGTAVITPIDPFTGKVMAEMPADLPLTKLKELKASFPERQKMQGWLISLQLRSSLQSRVLGGLSRLPTPEDSAKVLFELEQLTHSTNPAIRDAAKESFALSALQGFGAKLDEVLAIKTLGEVKSLRAVDLLKARLKVYKPGSALARETQKSMKAIEDFQFSIQIFDIIKSSISSASILILIALGLSITFGLMGVINMAHGEMLMIGAYTTYCLQILFGHTPENPAPLFFILAIPVSFLVSALVGGLIETTVIRRLYKRPIESLLASYGISLILIQIVRLIFGDNRATNSPDWLQGALTLAPGMSMPFNRLFILATAISCVVAIWFVLKHTRLGMDIQATMQNRDMASSMGINTRRVDSFTFMIGSGIAGIAGCAITTVGGITPDMGKNYIIDSFLVVVTGGVGNLAGVVMSGGIFGFLNKFLEGALFGAVWAKIIVLVAIMAFIQFKPRGLFAPKGRAFDE